MTTSWKTKLRAFRIWQRKPYDVGPLPQTWHDCNTCRTHFQGRYCPNCGQKATVGRYSFKTALLHFLDVWGMGNRGMFHTLRDLILRPGYMIRDYLSGMQNAYFPPFKLFFVLTTISLLVSHGINLRTTNYYQQARIESHESIEQVKEGLADGTGHPDFQLLYNTFDIILSFQENYPNLFSLSILIVLSLFLYPMFRRCPAIPDLRYSEFFVALIFTNNMYSLYSIVIEFFAIGKTGNTLEFLTMPLMLIPLKQLTGYPWWRVIVYALLTVALYFALIILGTAAITLIDLYQQSR